MVRRTLTSLASAGVIAAAAASPALACNQPSANPQAQTTPTHSTYLYAGRLHRHHHHHGWWARQRDLQQAQQSAASQSAPSSAGQQSSTAPGHCQPGSQDSQQS